MVLFIYFLMVRTGQTNENISVAFAMTRLKLGSACLMLRPDER